LIHGIRSDLQTAFTRRTVVHNLVWILLYAGVSIAWPVIVGLATGIPVGYAIALAIAAFLVGTALLLLVRSDAGADLKITFAMYGIPGREVEVRDKITRLVADDVLDFFVRSEVLGVDPAPGLAKQLRVRWTYRGKPDASSYLEGTHVVIPREAARQNGSNPPADDDPGAVRGNALRNGLARLLDEGNELRVSLDQASAIGSSLDVAFACDQMDAWGRRVQQFLAEHDPELVPIWRMEPAEGLPPAVPQEKYYRAWIVTRTGHLERFLREARARA
jgi:hypothetical protein